MGRVMSANGAHDDPGQLTIDPNPVPSTILYGLGTATVTQGEDDPGNHSIQLVQVNAITGTFSIWFDANSNGIHDAGETTAALPFNASPLTVQLALEAIVAPVYGADKVTVSPNSNRSEEHTSELQSRENLV